MSMSLAQRLQAAVNTLELIEQVVRGPVEGAASEVQVSNDTSVKTLARRLTELGFLLQSSPLADVSLIDSQEGAAWTLRGLRILDPLRWDVVDANIALSIDLGNYYNKTQIDGEMALRALSGHLHDDRYPRLTTAGQANGYATLDGTGKVPTAQLPAGAVSIGDVGGLETALNDKGPTNDVFTKAMLHFPGADGSTTIIDDNAGGSAHVWTANGNAQIDTAQSKFGGASLLCDGAGDFVSTPDHADFTLGTSDFTSDFWFNCNAAGGTIQWLFGQQDGVGTANTISVQCLRQTTNLIVFQAYNSAGAIICQITSTSQFTNGVNPGWHHLAVTRAGSSWRMFIDGVQEGGTQTSAAAVNDSSQVWSVGSTGPNIFTTWTGWIDEFRLSVGIARWTENFTPPSQEYYKGPLAPINSPAFTGTPMVPTPAGVDDSTKIANTEWVRDFVAGISAGVVSFEGRSGTVTSQAGDYNAGEITNTPAGNIAASTVQAAINELDSEKLAKGGDTLTGALIGESSGAMADATPDGYKYWVRAVAGAGNAAYMAFERPGSFAALFGMDTDNVWKVGGWAYGAVAYKMFHEGVAATQVQAEAGSDNTVPMTPLRTAQAIAALQRAIASQAEAEAGSDNTKDMTALRVAQAIVAQTGGGEALPPGFVSVRVANNGTDPNNDIDFAPGKCRDSTDVENIALASALTKRLDAAWTVGSNQGGLDTGSKAANTFYYLWVIKRTDNGTVDALFSASATAPTMPANYDRKQRVGFVRTDGSSNILPFKQDEVNLDEFRWTNTSFEELNVVTFEGNVEAQLRTITARAPPFSRALTRVVYLESSSAEEPGGGAGGD